MRRVMIGGLVLIFVTLGWNTPSLAQKAPAPRGELRSLYEQVIRTVDPARQRDLLQQMERQSHEQAYALFLYQPTMLYAANKTVEFVLYASGFLMFHETSVTEQHWSLRSGPKKK